MDGPAAVLGAAIVLGAVVVSWVRVVGAAGARFRESDLETAPERRAAAFMIVGGLQ